MKINLRTGLFYAFVLAAALWINSTWAQGGYESVAYEACAYHGCDGGYLVNIMMCESGGNPNAWHPNPYGGSDIGIMQINDATWGSIAYAGPVEQIWWAADMIASGHAYIWLCS